MNIPPIKQINHSLSHKINSHNGSQIIFKCACSKYLEFNLIFFTECSNCLRTTKKNSVQITTLVFKLRNITICPSKLLFLKKDETHFIDNLVRKLHHTKAGHQSKLRLYKCS